MVSIEDIIENTGFVTSLYGAIPDLNQITIRDFRFEHLSAVRISIVVAQPITNRPASWQDHNALYCDLLFSAVRKIDLHFRHGSCGIASVEIKARETGLACRLTGQLDCRFSFGFVSLQNFAPAYLR